ncbi:MAG: hypothetical protein ACOYNO_12015 [Saprospiraceae bacterium]
MQAYNDSKSRSGRTAAFWLILALHLALGTYLYQRYSAKQNSAGQPIRSEIRP